MADKVKLSKDGSSIDFVQTENIPTSVKKFRQSPEIEGFYRFVFENDLQKEAYEILERISAARKAKKLKDKQEAQAPKKAEAQKAAAIKAEAKADAKAAAKKVEAKAAAKPEPKKAAPTPASAKKVAPKKNK